MIGNKTKYQNQLQLSNSLRLKLFKQDVDIDAILNKNRKQTHSPHTNIAIILLKLSLHYINKLE